MDPSVVRTRAKEGASGTMDPVLARMLARKKQQQEEAEEEEWKPSPVKAPAKPSIPQESAPFVMDENDPIASVIGEALSLQQDDDSSDLQLQSSETPGTSLHRAAVAPGRAPLPAPPPVPEEASDPFAAFFGASGDADQAGATRVPAGDAAVPDASAHRPNAVQIDSAWPTDGEAALGNKASGDDDNQRAQPSTAANVPLNLGGDATGGKKGASNRRGRREETFTKISAADAASVPVLVIPTGGAGGGDWRLGAQDASSAYNG